jgi:hypothetical protein
MRKTQYLDMGNMNARMFVLGNALRGLICLNQLSADEKRTELNNPGRLTTEYDHVEKEELLEDSQSGYGIKNRVALLNPNADPTIQCICIHTSAFEKMRELESKYLGF